MTLQQSLPDHALADLSATEGLCCVTTNYVATAPEWHHFVVKVNKGCLRGSEMYGAERKVFRGVLGERGQQG